MSIPNLPINFKDDILNTSSNSKRKYNLVYNSDGTVSLEDVTVYSQKGSSFGAAQVNQTNTAINNIYSQRMLDLEDVELVNQTGFFVDALAVKELNSKLPNNAGNSGRAVYFSDGIATALSRGYILASGGVSPNVSKSFTVPVHHCYFIGLANAAGYILVFGYYYNSQHNFHKNVVQEMDTFTPTITYSNNGTITIKGSSQGSVDYICFVL